MPDPLAPSRPAPVADRCPKHDFPLDSAGCALCRQEAAQGYAGPQGPVPSATIPRRGGDPAVWIIGGALTFAGCVMPIAAGTLSALIAFLVFDTGIKLTLGIGLLAALAVLVGVFSSR